MCAVCSGGTTPFGVDHGVLMIPVYGIQDRAVIGCPPEIALMMKPAGARCQMGEWFPGQMCESVV